MSYYGMEHCFYVPGSRTIIDAATPEGVSCVFKENAEQIRARYPGAVFMPYEDAALQIQQAMIETYRPGELREITEERFIEMLEVLPPMKWEQGHGCESFLLSELQEGRITRCYVRIAKHYYEGFAYTNTTPAQLVAWGVMKRNRDYPEEFTKEMEQ